MATLSALAGFIIGVIVTLITILIFYFAARMNQNVATIYLRTICSGIA